MSITRRVTFRLYPSVVQNNKLHYWKKLHKLLYNACVSHRSTQYKRFGKSINYFDQQNCLPAFKECWTEYKELGSHALQATIKRVDCAFLKLSQDILSSNHLEDIKAGLILAKLVGKPVLLARTDILSYQT